MAGILFALGSGLYFILFPKGKPEDVVKALTVRIGLSVILFLMLLIGFATGWLSPHHFLFSTASKPTQTETTIPHPQNANTMPPLQKQNGAPE